MYVNDRLSTAAWASSHMGCLQIMLQTGFVVWVLKSALKQRTRPVMEPQPAVDLSCALTILLIFPMNYLGCCLLA